VVTRLQREMRAARIEKDYLAVVHGRASPPRGTIDLALDRDPWDRRKVTVTDRGGQRAVTRYERIAEAESHSLVRCRLVTGRMHQIRVHLAARGWPLVGDPVYGQPGSAPEFPRQALHAWRVAFTHPVTGEHQEIVAPLPEDMGSLLAELGLPLPAPGS
jgi:23S rRNA pseudouridine1911/1915/1917 synthase